MKVKTFEGEDEQKLLREIKEDMGVEAVILSIKKNSPKGIFSKFKKEKVIITAALDDDKVEESIEAFNGKDFLENLKNKKLDVIESNEEFFQKEKDASVTSLSEKDKIIKEQEEELSKLYNQINKSNKLIKSLNQNINSKKINSYVKEYENEVIQIMYDTLIEQNVMDIVAKDMLFEFKDYSIDEIDVTSVVKIIYNKIINIIGEVNKINLDNRKINESKVLFFIGPTGVGKTTTIAKISSKFIFEDDLSLGLVTADTYRIAAVDQLKTYASILGTDIEVAYNSKDLLNSYNKLNNKKDIILVDTAGRSHKNEANMSELIELLNVIPNSDKFLVLSLTTKSEDLVSIINTYKEKIDFNIIFTKVDETNSFGAIINACYLTNVGVSYITNGQSVPNDINLLDPEKVAKSILGLEVNDIC